MPEAKVVEPIATRAARACGWLAGAWGLGVIGAALSYLIYPGSEPDSNSPYFLALIVFTAPFPGWVGYLIANTTIARKPRPKFAVLAGSVFMAISVAEFLFGFGWSLGVTGTVLLGASTALVGFKRAPAAPAVAR